LFLLEYFFKSLHFDSGFDIFFSGFQIFEISVFVEGNSLGSSEEDLR